MRAIPGHARSYGVDGGKIGLEHHFVRRTLDISEPAVHGEGARDVGGIAAVLAAGVDQQQVAVSQRRFVLAVVEDAAVGTATDDRQVGDVRIGAVELVTDLSGDLVLEHVRPAMSHGPPMGRTGDGGRMTHLRDLGSALVEPHLVQRVLECDDLMRRMATLLGQRAQSVDPTDHALIEVPVDPDGVEHPGAVLHETGEDVVDVGDREGVIGAEPAARTGRAGTPAVPGLACRITVSHEQQVLALRSPRHQHRDRLRFGETGEVVEVAVLPVGVLDVVVAQMHGRRGDDGDGVASHLAHQRTPAAGVFLAADRRGRFSGSRRGGHRIGAAPDPRGKAPVLRAATAPRPARTPRVRRRPVRSPLPTRPGRHRPG